MKINIHKVFQLGIGWAQAKMNRQQFLIFSSILVGASAGLAAVLLKLVVHYIHMLITFPYQSPYIRYIYLILPLIGILLTVYLTRQFYSGKLNKGTAHILRSIDKKTAILPKSEMYSHVITSGVTVGLGGSAGLESPIVTTGSAIGSNYGRAYRLEYEERLVLLACGASAGIAGAFNSPIAGVLFSLEVLLAGTSIGAFIPLIISAAAGALCSMIILGEGVLLSFRLQEPFDYTNVIYYVLLGLCAGIIAVYYKRTFLSIERFLRFRFPHAYKKTLLGGVVLTLMIYCFPPLLGEGYSSIKHLAEQREDLVFASGFFSAVSNPWLILALIGITMLLKTVAASLTISSGGNGGNFAPSLFVGAYLGYFFSRGVNLLGLSSLPVSNFTLVAMAGILSGVFHAPLTGIFLIAEITGGYGLMIPLMIVSAISFAISKYFEPLTIDRKNILTD